MKNITCCVIGIGIALWTTSTWAQEDTSITEPAPEAETVDPAPVTPLSTADTKTESVTPDAEKTARRTTDTPTMTSARPVDATASTTMTVAWPTIDADRLELSGRNLQRIGVPILVTGITASGLAITAIIAGAVEDEPGPAAGGGIALGVTTLFITVPGIILTLTGRGRIRDADEIRDDRRQGTSRVQLIPIIDPLKHAGGVALQGSF